MTRRWLCSGIGLGSAGLILLLFARNELGRHFGPAGFFVDLMLPRHVTLPAFLLASAAAATVAFRGGRSRPQTALLVAAAALAMGVLADRSISYSWESKTLIDGYGPFGITHRGIDPNTSCVETGALTFRIADGPRRFALFRGIPPLRFAENAPTSRFPLEPCPTPR